jgi:hypothetical protein
MNQASYDDPCILRPSAFDEAPQIPSCFTFEGLSGGKVVQLANQT